MAAQQNSYLADQQGFSQILEGINHLESLAYGIGIKRQSKQSSSFNQEHDKSIKGQNAKEQLELIKETTNIANIANILLETSLKILVSCASRKSMHCTSLSSAISYIREQKGLYQPPHHLLHQWQRNLILIDLLASKEGLYCNKSIAQDMFDICMETFDWLRSLANNNK